MILPSSRRHCSCWKPPWATSRDQGTWKQASVSLRPESTAATWPKAPVFPGPRACGRLHPLGSVRGGLLLPRALAARAVTGSGPSHIQTRRASGWFP